MLIRFNLRKNQAMYKPVFILAGLIPAASLVAAEPTKEQLDFFDQKVRPILSNNCYSCHSVEQGKSKGGMTLDTADAARKGGDTGKGIVPGDPAKSLIYVAMTHKDSDLQMPPASKGGKLKDDEIAVIEQWIKMGAPDPRKVPAKQGKLTGLTEQARAHWAYQPVKHWKSIAVPKPKNSAWMATPIDAFILEKLEAKNILPSPPATKETLLRRAYYDLIGMPPSPAQVQAFIADQSPGAWEKVIEQLLASPHYGERWGRHWLDSARYADTIGGDANTNNGRNDYRYAHAWTYRDYVIRALNEDKPYNEFITEQLAADYLYPLKPLGTYTAKKPEPAPEPPKAAPKPDPLNLGNKTAATPAKAAASKAEPAMEPAMMTGGDMMMTGGGPGGPGGPAMEGHPNLAALGFLTVGERFNNNNDVINDRIDVVTKAFTGLTVACARCHDHMFDPISTKDYYALHGVFASISEPAEKPLISSPDKAARADYEQKKKAIEEENRNIYFREVEHWLGLFQSKPQHYLKAALLREDRSEKAQQERDALLKSEQLDGVLANYYGRVLNKNNRVFGPLYELREVKKSEWDSHAPLVLKYIAGEKRYNPIVMSELVAAKPGSMEQAIGVYNSILLRLSPKLTGLVKAYQSATTDKGPEGMSADELEIISGAFSLTPAPKADTNWVRMATNGWPVQFTGRARFVFAKLNDLDLTHPGAPARAMTVKDRDRAQNSNVLIRGQAGTPGEMVPRRFLDILSPGHKAEPFKQGSGRLELARAITHKDNPLTGRVLVNRVWMQHFGEGFVRTPDDLGVMSETPTHPELVDYLASWFTDEKAGNWSLKNLHRFIMRSRAYQASSNGRKEYEAIDPENRLLWRANVRRLDFEALRDSMLVFSGRLDPKVGGQPVNITDEPYTYRRSIYGYIDRGNVPELMGHFDFSDPDMPNSKRATTIVPQQALFLMNSPMAVDVARRVAARPEFKAASNDQARIFAIYNILFQRQPKPGEIAFGYGFIKQELQKQPEVDALAPELAKKTAAAIKRIEERKKRDNDAMRPVQNSGEVVERKPLTPWESYVHALLFCNESAYVN
jgi:Protein of unknown function (DUF1553)/Protein of unknown function (DUF1549)/Planctomycete cytochrome C